jgi:hypothetical protein
MSMPPADAQPTWTVTGQVERDQVTPGSAPVKGMQIFFTTQLGQQGSVFVPYAQYTTTYVTQQLARMAAQVDAIKGLTGGVGSY